MPRHRPDHEMEVMRNGMKLLAKLSPEGRARVVAYWSGRLAQFPPVPATHGEQQLDIEDMLRSEPLPPDGGAYGPHLTN